MYFVANLDGLYPSRNCFEFDIKLGEFDLMRPNNLFNQKSLAVQKKSNMNLESS